MATPQIVPAGCSLMPELDTPHIQANSQLRAFRSEANVSWKEFNKLWVQICNFINAPSNDVLFDHSRAGEIEYRNKLTELIGDLLATGRFGLESRGNWRFGQHATEPHQEAVADYVGRVTAYAGKRIMEQVPIENTGRILQADKVGGWLMNRDATEWDRYNFVHRPQNPSTFIVTSGPPGSTTVPDTVVGALSRPSDYLGSTTIADTVVDADEGVTSRV